MSEPTDAEFQRVTDKTAALFQEHGKDRVFALTAEGQFAFPKLGGFAGIAPDWVNDNVRRIASEQLGNAEHVAVVDWHTGVGDPETFVFLCFHDGDSAAYKRACAWWGDEPIEKGMRRFDEFSRPKFRGLLIKGVAESIQTDNVTGVVIEFGTYPWTDVRNALLVDQWMRYGPGEKSEADIEKWRAFMLEKFCPSEEGWRVWALDASTAVHTQAIEGLAKL
ncbi:MAG: DUF2817 domain-containing protein [Pseudomonadota bacterium]